MIFLKFSLILLLQTVLSKELFISYSTESESSELFKYFHSMQNEFYVDIGAYDPIYASNTIYFLNWKGINVEANTHRHRNFLFTRPNQINLNAAITKSTGGFATLIQYSKDSRATIDSDFIKLFVNQDGTAKQQQVYQITMADLCHGYYTKRPKFMSIDIEGHGLVALRSNDWTDEKCQPEVIITEHIQSLEQGKDEQKKFLEQKGYLFQKQSQLNQYYIHKSLIDVYKKRQEQGQKLLKNMTIIKWFPLFQAIFNKFAPTFDTDFQSLRHIDQKTSPLYIRFVSQRIVSIEKIREQSRFLNNYLRPILLLHYNPTRSKLYLGSTKYKTSKIMLKVEQNEITINLLEIRYAEQIQNIYVLEHNFKELQGLQIFDKLDQQTCKTEDHLASQKMQNSAIKPNNH